MRLEGAVLQFSPRTVSHLFFFVPAATARFYLVLVSFYLPSLWCWLDEVVGLVAWPPAVQPLEYPGKGRQDVSPPKPDGSHSCRR